MRRTLLLLAAAIVIAAFALSGCETVDRITKDPDRLCPSDHAFKGLDPKTGLPVCEPKPKATTTTTTSTTTSTTLPTTTTTTTTLPPRPAPTPTIPPVAPTPQPCVPDPPMPAGPASVRGRADDPIVAPSSCERPSENMKCFAARGDVADYPPGISDCWNYQQLGNYNLSRGYWTIITRPDGLRMLCDEAPRGCYDFYGRRYSNNPAEWNDGECYGSDCRQPAYPFSGQYGGLCPPRAPRTCAPAPQPTPTPGPPAAPGEQPAGCYAGPWRMHCRFQSCDIQGEPGGSVFERPVAEIARRLFGEVEREVPNESLTEHGRALARELRAAGFCVATHEDHGSRVSDDEVAVWSPANPQKEHLDFARATGATPGFSVLLQRPFMVAKGIP